MSEEIMVRMHQIHKHFNGTEVLKGIDLEVKRGGGARNHRPQRLGKIDPAALPESSRKHRSWLNRGGRTFLRGRERPRGRGL